MATPIEVPRTVHHLLVQCPAVAGNTVHLNLGPDIRTVSIQGWDSTGEIEKACYYSRVQGQNDGDLIEATRVRVSEGGMLPIVMSDEAREFKDRELFVASTVVSGKVTLIISVYPL